jgi:hypothetical protein
VAVGALRRLAAAAPAPVYAAIGAGMRPAVEDLGLLPGVDLARSVRHAGVLLVAGEGRPSDLADLRRLHDQMPHPRATVWWRTAPAWHSPDAAVAEDSPASVLAAVWRELLGGTRRSEPDLLPDEPPAEWRGKGDHGQGGEGMMGGKPYGRPMAMTGDDLRDGLALDAVTVPLGPYLPMLPPGLKLEVTFQGDVVQRARVLRPPLPQGADEPPLRRAARLLRALGLEAGADGLLRAAAEGPAQGLARVLRWTGAATAVPPGLGVVEGRDSRDRLLGLCRAAANGADGEYRDADPRSLVELLTGLEWAEAVLVINSFGTEELIRRCPADEQAEDA